MRNALLTLVVFGLAVGGVGADENDLSNGVFIAHYAPSLVYTDDIPHDEWGEVLQNSEDAIHGCNDQINRLDGQGDHMMWFVISAWDEDKIWPTTVFGFVGYDPAVWVFQDNGPVYPPGLSGLEILIYDFPHGDPPGSPSGVLFGVSGGPCWGPANFEPVWWFEGYAYGPDNGETVIQMDVEPFDGTGGWYSRPGPYYFPATCFGAMGVNTDGAYCCPSGLEYSACCFPDGSCEVMVPEDCVEAGGLVYEDSDTCEPNPCPPTTTSDGSWGSIKAMYR
jgi:hypothetical protein